MSGLKNKKPSTDHKVKFTFGNTISQPLHEKEISIEILANEPKWTRFPTFSQRQETSTLKLGDFFKIKRGIATGDNKFFIIPREKIEQLNLPIEYFRPILPSPRYLDSVEIYADERGNPKIKKSVVCFRL